MLTRKNIVFFILILLGVCLRFYFSANTFAGLSHDAGYYVILANKILSGEFVADCCGKNSGYPFFLAINGYFFGLYNIWALRWVQIILDLISAVIIYVVGLRLFKNQKAAGVSFILYLFNPFTVAYTGLRLPETLSIFLVSITLLIITSKPFAKNFRLWIILGTVLGISLFVRLQFYYFVFILIAAFSLFYFNGRSKIYFFILSFLGFIIFSSYSLFANYAVFGKMSLTPPKDLKWAFLYLDYYDYEYPELFLDEKNMHPELRKITAEYLEASFDPKLIQIDRLNDYYRSQFMGKIKSRPDIFLGNIAKNFIRIWDKTQMSVYIDPFYPADKPYLRVWNLVSISLFITGILGFIYNKKEINIKNPVVLYSLILFLYISILFPLVTNESRHTLIFYPLIFLWSGYGIKLLKYNIDYHLKKKNG